MNGRCSHDVAGFRVLRERMRTCARTGRYLGMRRDVGCLECGATWYEDGWTSTVRAAESGDQRRIAELRLRRA